MTEYNIAVVGAGAVGVELLRVLRQRAFPVREVRVLARSARRIEVDGKFHDVLTTTQEAFAGIDIALFAGTEGEKGAAVTFGPAAARRGVAVIDNGADFRMRPDVPLVVPEVNGYALAEHQGIIANPNCSTAQLVMALKPIHDAVRVTRVIIATYQAVSGAGGSAVEELKAEQGAVGQGLAITSPGPTFSMQIAGNVIPQIGGFDAAGYTSEEMKLVHETHKILGDDTIGVTPIVTARVPVRTGHSEAVYIETERHIGPEEARALWSEFPGVAVLDDPLLSSSRPYAAYPTPLHAEGKDTTFIGRVRQDIVNPNGLNFWIVSDNLRKGAATNAVQIAETLVHEGWVHGAR